MTTHEGTALEVRETSQEISLRHESAMAELNARIALVHDALKTMKKGTHYGVIPGVEKPSLWQPGAEYLDVAFRLRPEFTQTKEREGQHLTVVTECSIFHIPSGECWARGVAAVASTYESQYRWRKANRSCPECGAEAIFKSKHENGGWYCWAKRGGCGAKFAPDDERITKQETGRKENEDLADQWETIVAMSRKRSHVAATRMATSASDVFTQDVEDMPEFSRSAPVEASGPAEDSEPGTQPEAKQDDKPDPAAAIKLVQAIKKHPKYNQQAHGVPTRKDGVPKLQKLLDELEDKPTAEDPLEVVRSAIVLHPQYKAKGGDEAFGAILKDGDEETLNDLLSHLNENSEQTA